MLNRLPLLAIILLTHGTHAQDWSLFPLGQRSYFQLTSDTGLAVVSQVMDSIKPDGTNNTLYFHRKQGPDSLNDCFQQALAGAYWLPLPDSPFPMDSMTVQGDTAYWFPAPGDGNFFFLPHVPVGQSWTVPPVLVPGEQQTTFTCTGAQQETFLGVSDSVKTFSISTSGSGAPPIDGFQFKLSKNHGLMEYLPFILTVPHGSWLPLKTYSLIGIDDGSTSHGYVQPDFSDYFHLSAGDILQWEENYVPFNISQPAWTLYQQDSITSALITPDSVVYTFQRTTMDTSLAITQVMPGTNRLLREKLSYLAGAPTNWYGIGGFSDGLWADWQLLAWRSGALQLIVEPGSGDTISMYSFTSDATSLDPEYCQFGIATDLYFSFTMDTRVGVINRCMEMTSSPDCWNLIGWRIDGVVTGDIKMAEGTTSMLDLDHAAIAIVPNPAHDRLQIHGLAATGLCYTVLDPTGRELRSGRVQEGTVPLSGIGAGAYLVRLTYGNEARCFRFMKE